MCVSQPCLPGRPGIAWPQQRNVCGRIFLPRVRLVDDSQGRFSGRVGQTVNRVEDVSSSSFRDQDSRFSQRRVAYNGMIDPGEMDVFESEGGGWLLVDGTLFTGQFGEVDI